MNRYLCSIDIDIDAETPSQAAQAMWQWLSESAGPWVAVQLLDADRLTISMTTVNLSEVPS
jgi:hypothetical protein